MPTSNPAEGVALRLIGYARIRGMATIVQADGLPVLRLAEEDLKKILRRFLALIPFDEAAYLRANLDLAAAIAAGDYAGTGQQHFVTHGYFEGRSLFPGFKEIGGDAAGTELDLPNSYFQAVFHAWTAADAGRHWQAMPILAEVLKQYGPHDRVLRLIAQCYLRLGMHRLAAAALAQIAPQALSVDDLMTMESAFQVLNLFDQAGNVLQQAAAKTGYADPSINRKLAVSQGHLGNLGTARAAFARLSRSELGGDGTAINNYLYQAISQSAATLRTLIPKARSRTLTVADEIELVLQLARFGFRATAGRRLPAAMQRLRSDPAAPDTVVQSFVDAARLCRGPAAALKASALLGRSDNQPQAVLRDAQLMYASHRFQSVLDRLDTAGAASALDEDTFQCKIDSLLMLDRSAEALDVCRDWRVRLPRSGKWSTATMRVLFEHGMLQDTPVDIAAPGAIAPNPVQAAAIPMNIVQYWNDEHVPPDVLACMDSWKSRNPTFAYARFNDSTAAEMLRNHYGDDIRDAFERCHHPVMKADYFLLGYINARGGCYVDADERCNLPLQTVIEKYPGKALLLVRSQWMILLNSPLMAIAGHPMIGTAFRRASDRLLSAKPGDAPLPIWDTTGNGLLSRVFIEAILDDEGDFNSTTALISEWDSARISVEENLAYKSDPRRNWRIS